MSLVGGLISSASWVASAGSLAAKGTIPPDVAATGAVLASLASALVNIPLAAQAGQDRSLTRRVAIVLIAVTAAGIVGFCCTFARLAVTRTT